MRFPRQKYWSGLPFPTPGDLPDLEIEPESPTSLALAGRFFTTLSHLGSPVSLNVTVFGDKVFIEILELK